MTTQQNFVAGVIQAATNQALNACHTGNKTVHVFLNSETLEATQEAYEKGISLSYPLHIVRANNQSLWLQHSNEDKHYRYEQNDGCFAIYVLDN